MIDGAEAKRIEARWGSDPSDAHSEAYKSGGLSEAYESGGVGERSEGLGSAAWGGVRNQAGCCWGVETGLQEECHVDHRIGVCRATGYRRLGVGTPSCLGSALSHVTCVKCRRLRGSGMNPIAALLEDDWPRRDRFEDSPDVGIRLDPRIGNVVEDDEAGLIGCRTEPPP